MLRLTRSCLQPLPPAASAAHHGSIRRQTWGTDLPLQRIFLEVWRAPLAPLGPEVRPAADQSQIQRLDSELELETRRRATDRSEVVPMRRNP